MKYLNIKYLFLILIVIAVSCDSSEEIKDVNAKIIKYQVNYIDEKAGSVPTKILPTQMTLIFADHYALNTIEGFFGQFSLVYIANRKKKTVTTLLKIFDKKFYYTGESNELPCGIDPMTDITITEGNSEAEFAGFTGHEKIIKRDGKPDLSIYTTDQIKVKNPNHSTPYQDIDEVLLVFYSKLSVMGMMMIANEYSEKVISNKIFKIPEEYKAVSRVTMEKTINELFK